MLKWLRSRLAPEGLSTARFHLDRFAAQAAASLPAGALMLDAGAGDSPYRRHFAHVTYEASDGCVRPAHQYQHVQYVCDLTAIPVEDSRYDLVLCTQVLEHVPRPLEALRELHRVLKPGGKLWISAPLYFEEHEIPYDFYRYTQYGWKHLMKEAGFDIERMDWVQGYFGTLAHQLNLARHQLPRQPRDFGGGFVGVASAGAVVLLKPAFGLAGWFFSRLDLRHKHVTSGHCTDYCLVARKPLAAPAAPEPLASLPRVSHSAD